MHPNAAPGQSLVARPCAGPPRRTPAHPPEPHPHDPARDWREWADLTGLPEPALSARRHVAAALKAHGMPSLVEDAELIADELAANAAGQAAEGIRWGRTPTIAISVTGWRGEACISAFDTNPQPPPRGGTPDRDDEHGRGLMIVSALSQRWGWSPSLSAGKFTWAILPGPGQPS